ncbi:MAG: DUF3016 domain-containing protein [Verrucomicrobiota bacterium]
MKTFIITTVVTVCFNIAASASIETSYIEPRKFTDLELTNRSKDTSAALFDREVKASKILHQAIGEGRTLELTFTDVDLAGEILPFIGRHNNETRVIRSVYPPRIEFNYILKDESGNEIATGTEKLVDINFQIGIRRPSSSDIFYYEIDLLEEWAKKVLVEKAVKEKSIAYSSN